MLENYNIKGQMGSAKEVAEFYINPKKPEDSVIVQNDFLISAVVIGLVLVLITGIVLAIMIASFSISN